MREGRGRERGEGGREREGLRERAWEREREREREKGREREVGREGGGREGDRERKREKRWEREAKPSEIFLLLSYYLSFIFLRVSSFSPPLLLILTPLPVPLFILLYLLLLLFPSPFFLLLYSFFIFCPILGLFPILLPLLSHPSSLYLFHHFSVFYLPFIPPATRDAEREKKKTHEKHTQTQSERGGGARK